MRKSALAAPIAGAAFLLIASTAPAHAASCCGGGGASSLILPKASNEMFGLLLEGEHYDGLWRQDGHWVPDPEGSDLNQYRTNFGYARRLGARWQGAVNLQYAWNRTTYAGFSRDTGGPGDTTLALLYETFDDVTCVYQVNGWQDLVPAVYLGAALLVPTGVSPYDDVTDNFDITGRGFYRLEGTVLAEKTIYPWNFAVQFTYGTHLERPVNREFGNYVEPYRKRLGDRVNGIASMGYTWSAENFDTWTATLAYSDLQEGKVTIDGATDPTTGFRKRSLAASVAFATGDRRWVVKGTWNHTPREDDWGENFPATDLFTLGVNRLLQ